MPAGLVATLLATLALGRCEVAMGKDFFVPKAYEINQTECGSAARLSRRKPAFAPSAEATRYLLKSVYNVAEPKNPPARTRTEGSLRDEIRNILRLRFPGDPIRFRSGYAAALRVFEDSQLRAKLASTPDSLTYAAAFAVLPAPLREEARSHFVRKWAGIRNGDRGVIQPSIEGAQANNLTLVLNGDLQNEDLRTIAGRIAGNLVSADFPRTRAVAYGTATAQILLHAYYVFQDPGYFKTNTFQVTDLNAGLLAGINNHLKNGRASLHRSRAGFTDVYLPTYDLPQTRKAGIAGAANFKAERGIGRVPSLQVFELPSPDNPAQHLNLRALAPSTGSPIWVRLLRLMALNPDNVAINADFSTASINLMHSAWEQLMTPGVVVRLSTNLGLNACRNPRIQ